MEHRISFMTSYMDGIRRMTQTGAILMTETGGYLNDRSWRPKRCVWADSPPEKQYNAVSSPECSTTQSYGRRKLVRWGRIHSCDLWQTIVCLMCILFAEPRCVRMVQCGPSSWACQACWSCLSCVFCTFPKLIPFIIMTQPVQCASNMISNVTYLSKYAK